MAFDFDKQRYLSPLRWLLRRKLELAIFALGVALRLSMAWNYHFSWNYDSDLHWDVVQWILEHDTVPNTESSFEAFHPPLYYLTAAWLVAHGVTRAGLVWLSIGCGVARLAIIWAGLELYVANSRAARVAGLALAAVISASVHLDGMVYTEALSCVLNAGVMLLLPLAFRRTGQFRWPLALVIGLLLGLALLTKVSALVMIGAIGAAVAFEFVFVRRPLRVRVANALPWAGMLAVVLALCGWYYAQNVRQYGTPLVTSFSLPSQKWLVEAAEKKPVLDRRSLGFLFGWDADVYKSPYRPSGLGWTPRFFPISVATSVVDYWGFGFAGYEPRKPGERERTPRVNSAVLTEARLAMVGGTLLFLAILSVWLVAMWRVLRSCDVGRLALLLIPLLMLLAALQFAVAYPVDDYGVIKSVYMMFAAPPLFALFGVAVAWSLRRPTRWPLFAALGLSLSWVGWYSVVCRFGWLLPAGG